MSIRCFDEPWRSVLSVARHDGFFDFESLQKYLERDLFKYLADNYPLDRFKKEKVAVKPVMEDIEGRVRDHLLDVVEGIMFPSGLDQWISEQLVKHLDPILDDLDDEE